MKTHDHIDHLDHVYLIANTYEIQYSQSFIEKYSNLITPVVIHDFVIDNDLTHEILSHIDQLDQLTSEQFDWKYYMSKYPEIDRVSSKTDTWKHWINYGHPHHYNPIDRKSIATSEQVMLNMAVIQVLLDSIEHEYQQILIINTIVSDTISSDTIVPSEIHEDVVIYTSHDTTYAYSLKNDIFPELLVELSYFMYNVDDVIDAYLSIHQTPYQVVAQDHATNDTVPIMLQSVMELNEDCQPIIDFRQQYLSDVYSDFNTKIGANTDIVDYVLHTYPFDYIKTHWCRDMNLNAERYMYLCYNVSKFCYFSRLKIRQTQANTCELDAIYFDRDFYLKTYPCYNTVFKNYDDAFGHFSRHGIGERLLPNQAIFTLTQHCQEYLLHHYLESVVPISPSLNDPLIYILTRTCNREKLFKQCVSSIQSQNYANLRHIVSYDNIGTLTYVKQYPHIHQSVDLTSKKSVLHPNQYVDCLYDVILKKDPGWVLVIDDDDKLMTPDALHYLKQYLVDPQNLVIWMLYRPDKFIYPQNKNLPVVGDIGSCCYLYHTSTIQKGYWGPSAIGDFPCFRRLFSRAKKHIYVDMPLTGVNYENHVSGWTAL
jgi:hypothetical protein